MTLGERIKMIRLNLHLKQQELADRAKVSRVAIGNYERGERQPTAEILQKIANALDVSVDALLGVEQKKNLWEEFDRQHPNMKDKVERFEIFIRYLKTLGYCVDIKNYSEDSYYAEIKKNNVFLQISEKEFEELQDKCKENVDGAILLQQHKNMNNKKEPSSAATENDSNNN